MKKKIFLFLFLLLIIPISKVKALDITYQTHVQNIGWMDWVKNGELSGTTGLSRRMEAIRIKLTGDLSIHYDILYRSHVQNIGWMDWVKNGELSGTTGLSRRMEAIEIKLVKLETKEEISLTYTIHNTDGWQEYVENGKTAGTTGESKSIDSLKIKLNNTTNIKGNILYRVNSINLDWQEEVDNDKEAGDLKKPIQAIKINLTDELKEKYNIFYRVHVSYVGWMDWTGNGEPAGTVGYFNKIEAIEIKLLPKDDKIINISSNSYKEYNNKVLYSSHVQGYGWQDYVSEGISGTEGQNRRAEAFKIKLDTAFSGDIIYKTYISKRGWSEEEKNDSISGTTGLGRNLEAISIKLTGNISNYYDIYYRTHMSYIGWTGWAKNGEETGCLNTDKSKIEAIEIKLVEKGIDPKLDTSKRIQTGSFRDGKYYDAFGNMATGFKLIDGVKYFFNSEGKQYGKDVNKVIDVSSWQETVDWDKIKKNDDVDAAIIRVGWGTDDGASCGLDSYFDRNVKEVQRLGIPYSIYIYAYANNETYAKQEADYVVSKMKEYNMPKDTYVWYDAELKNISRDTYNKVIPTFINRVKESGYTNVGVYSGVSQLDTTNGNTNTNNIRSYPIWVSQYYKNLQYTGEYLGWQFSSTEYVDGISGYVDVSMFKK